MDERSAYLQISETGSKRLPPCPHVGGLWRDLFRPLQGLPHGGAGKENHFAHASLLAVSYTHLDVYKRQVLNYLGYSWVDQNMNLDEGFNMLRRAVELRPTDGYIVDSLGLSLIHI